MLLTSSGYLTSMKLKKLTGPQNKFYLMLIEFFGEHQRMPTQAEASKEVGYKSPNASYELICALVSKGYLQERIVSRIRRYTFTEYKAVLTKISQPEV